MLTLIRNRAGLVLAGLLAALAPMLMAPTGGLPSRPLFQAVGVGAAVPATGILNAATDLQINGTSISGGLGSSNIPLLNASALTFPNLLSTTIGATSATSNNAVSAHTNSTHETAFVADSSGTAAACLSANGSGVAGQCGMPAGDSGLAVQGTMFLHASNGTIQTDAGTVPWAVTTSGTFTATLSTGCTTTPTTTAKWAKTGSLVVIEYAGFSSCTSNSVLASTDNSIPAAIRPPVTHGLGPIVDAEDNGGRTLACVSVTSTGGLSFSLFSLGAGFNGCSGTSFTNTGTKGFGGGFVVTYQTSN